MHDDLSVGFTSIVVEPSSFGGYTPSHFGGKKINLVEEFLIWIFIITQVNKKKQFKVIQLVKLLIVLILKFM